MNLRDIVEQFDPRLLVFISESIGRHQRSVDEQGEPVSNMALPLSFQEHGAEIFGPVLEQCQRLSLVASVASLKRLIELLRKAETTQGDMKEVMKDFHRRLVDELEGQYFFSLSAAEAARYDDWRKGWTEILARFPDTVRDVEEMNKCFALNRYPAAMFHALHVAEWGAIQLGKYIGVTDPKEGWGPTERKLSSLIASGHSALPMELKGKFEFLEQMNREIDSMVLAWRHKVDHAANHLAILPNTEFTPDIAEHVIGAIRIFMLRLIEGMTV